MERVDFFTEEAKEYIFGKDEGTNFVIALRNKGIYDLGFQKKISEIQPKKFIEYVKKYLYQMWIVNEEEQSIENKHLVQKDKITDLVKEQKRLFKKYRKAGVEKTEEFLYEIEDNLNEIKANLSMYKSYDEISSDIYECIAKSFFVLNGFTDREKWIQNQFNKADSNKANRDSVFIWGFGLNMSEEVVSAFLKRAIREMDFHFRNPYEVVMYYCFKNRLGYKGFKRIWNEFIVRKSHYTMLPQEHKEAEKYTLLYKDDATKLNTEEELFDFLLELVSDLTIQEVSKVVLYTIEDGKKVKVPISHVKANNIMEILLNDILPKDIGTIDNLSFKLKLSVPRYILVDNYKNISSELYNKEVERIYNMLANVYRNKSDEKIYSFEIEENQIIGLRENETYIALKDSQIIYDIVIDILDVMEDDEAKLASILEQDTFEHILEQMQIGSFRFKIKKSNEVVLYWFDEEFSKVEETEQSFYEQKVKKLYRELKKFEKANNMEGIESQFYIETVPYEYGVMVKTDNESEDSYWQSVTMHSLSMDREFDVLLEKLKKELANVYQKKVQGRDPKPIRKISDIEKKERKRELKMSEWTNWGDSDVLNEIAINEKNCKTEWKMWKKYLITWKEWIWGKKLDKNVLGYKNGEHIINRYDLINMEFWCCMYDTEFMEKGALERYSIFKDRIDTILSRCNMQGLYPPDPYEMFIAMCVQSAEPKATYRVVMWEIEKKRKTEAEQNKASK